MKYSDVTLIAAPFGFGPTSKALSIARALVARGISVKLLGDASTQQLASDAGIPAYSYVYRGTLDLSKLNTKLTLSYLDISTTIIKRPEDVLLFGDSLFFLRGWYERSYDYPAEVVLAQPFFKPPLKTEVSRAGNYREVGAILSSGFLRPLPVKNRMMVFYPGGLRSPYLGDAYGLAYYNWCKAVILSAIDEASWQTSNLIFVLPPQLNRPEVTAELDHIGINVLAGCSDLSAPLMKATHAMISPGIETTLEALASGINPIFTPAFNGSHIPQLIADRGAGVGFELSRSFNLGASQFEGGTNNLSKLSMQVEEYTMEQLSNSAIRMEAIASLASYLRFIPSVENRFPLGNNGAFEIAQYIENRLSGLTSASY